MKPSKFFVRFLFILSHPWYLYSKLRAYLVMKRNPGLPWLTLSAIRRIEEIINHDWTLFEWGSGRSTIWFSKRVRKVISVEHNEIWFKKIFNEIETKKIQNLSIYLVEISEFEKSGSEIPIFNEYTDFILKFPDNSLDCILIDGRNRNACLVNSIKKLKQGGYLILDNTERKYNTSLFTEWPCYETSNGVWKTAILKKP